jgi:hypothetical protein
MPSVGRPAAAKALTFPILRSGTPANQHMHRAAECHAPPFVRGSVKLV